MLRMDVEKLQLSHNTAPTCKNVNDTATVKQSGSSLKSQMQQFTCVYQMKMKIYPYKDIYTSVHCHEQENHPKVHQWKDKQNVV